MRRLPLHRPSAATVISLVALFFAMSGTAVAATGGDFILGKPNTATSVTSLSNTNGTALSLSSDALYEQAGMTPPGAEAEENATLDAINADLRLTSRQRRALAEIYESFVASSPPARRNSH